MIGQTISHYRILEKVGAGGMGVVYRAHDEQLDRDVALKVLPAGTLTDEAARKQFRKEALALARLNHPNVETVFEFSSQNGIDFLAMELIAGSLLSDKLKQGPLPEKDVLRLGIQFVEGLAAAHDQGVIHRDLKAGNLFITREGRLKILDFGLAKFVRPEPSGDVTQTITTDGSAISGTLPYMSPEQLSGSPLDARSDIYSAGVVLYEMATGCRPFRQTQSARLIGAILHEAPIPLGSVNRGVSPGLESVISKTLEKEPGQRYQSARELRAAIEGISMATASTAPMPVLAPASVPSRTLRWIAIGVGFCVVLVVGVGLGLNVRGLRDRLLHRTPTAQESHNGPGGPLPARRSVAVLGFKNVSGRPDQAWVSTALSDMLTTDLAAGEQLRTVPSENVAEMKINLSLPDADSYGRETLRKMYKSLDADDVVVGSYIPMGRGQIRLDLRLQDAVNGGILDAVSEKGSETQMDDLVNRAGAELRAKLGVGAVSSVEAAEVRAAVSSNPEAEKLYSEGLADLRAFDNLKAKDLLEKATAIDPNFALAHSALASAWKGLGYDEKAKDEAKKALALSAGLSREDRLRVEGQCREMANEWGKAVETYHALFRFFPDNLEYGVLLAKSQTRAGESKDALATIESLRRLPPPAGKDPRIDLAAAEASYFLGNFKLAQSFAAAAAQKARATEAKLLLARALYRQSSALENLGQAKDAKATGEEARAIYAAAGDRTGVASTLEVSANVLDDQGDFPDAIASYSQELAIVREVGDKRAEASALNNTASVLDQQGDLTGAKKMYEQALAAFREIDDKNNSAATLLNIGTVLQDQGDLAGAKRIYEQALGAFHEVDDKHGTALVLSDLGSLLDGQGNFAVAKNMLDQAIAIDLESGRKTPSSDKLVDLGDLLQHQGDLADAAKRYRDALELSRAAGDKSMAADALFGLGNLAMTGADFARAKQDFDEALALRNELGEKENADATRVALADLVMEQGHPDQAAASLREAREDLRKAKRVDDEIAATCLLARTLLAQRDVAGAQREVEGVSAVARKDQNLAVRLDFAIASALVQAASGRVSSAKANLSAALEEATRTRFLGYGFEARLALAEIGLKSTQAAESRVRLKELETEATARGFNLIARKAATAKG